MKRLGPVLTLAVGAGVAAVLMILNLNASSARDDADAAAQAAAQQSEAQRSGAAQADATSAAPAATTKPPAAAQVTYAGYLGGGGATLAIAVTDGKAIAYVCDGKKAEAWLQGTAAGGELDLSGLSDAKLTGTYAGGRAKGTVTAAGKSWKFNIGTVKPPSGLYRASADVRGATVTGGWVVLADGTQVGVLTVAGVSQPATEIDTDDPSVDVDGTTVTVTPVDGTALN